MVAPVTLAAPTLRDDQGAEPQYLATVAAGEWLGSWLAAGHAARRAVDAVLDAEADAGRLTGPWVAREVAAAVRPGEVLVTAASNAVRDLDLAVAPRRTPDAPRVLAGRGLAGIDGTLSTATGAALAAGAPTTVLVGDLAFLHDANGLLLPPGEPQPDLRVVVLDDDGGGIFTGLEHGADLDTPAAGRRFERLFGTPHGHDLGAVAAALGVPVRRCDDAAQLRAALAAPVSGREVLVVRADRSRLRDLHARIRTAAAETWVGSP